MIRIPLNTIFLASLIPLVLSFHYPVVAFMGRTVNKNVGRRKIVSPSSLSSQSEVQTENNINQERLATEASKFTILTCSSTACAKKRDTFQMDEYATYGAFFSRIQENESQVKVEESPCLGSCKFAPCVAIEHEDFVGQVALEGMSSTEFDNRWYVLHKKNPIYTFI